MASPAAGNQRTKKAFQTPGKSIKVQNAATFSAQTNPLTTPFVHVVYVYMRTQPKVIEFDWDKGNLDKSYRKHGISSKETEEVFVSEEFFVIPDVKHSQAETRFIGLGQTITGKKLLVIFTMRQNKIRIISARRIHRKEVDKYEKAKKDPSF